MYRATKLGAPQNQIVPGQVEPFNGEIEKTGRVTGTYAVNKNDIAITSLSERNRIPFIIKGRSSTKRNFVTVDQE